MEITPQLAERIARIREKVRAKGTRLGPRLSQDEIRRFEERYGISLPEGYREFLLQVGNGGLGGAAYGMPELGSVSEDMRQSQREIFEELPHIGKPFPFTKTWCWENDEDSDEGTREQTAYGCINIGNDGCAQYWFLIVTGKERGNVWMICGEGATPTVPKRDFLQWYEDWLDGNRDWWSG